MKETFCVYENVEISLVVIAKTFFFRWLRPSNPNRGFAAETSPRPLSSPHFSLGCAQLHTFVLWTHVKCKKSLAFIYWKFSLAVICETN